MKFDVVKLVLKTDIPIDVSPSKIRGFFGKNFKKYSILHNHLSNDKYRYSYPLVQYNVIGGNIVILGIDNGGKILKSLSADLSSLTLDKEYKIMEKIIYEREYDIKPTREERHYQFITPWLALNTKNYSKYNDLNSWKEKKELINKILVGNILSMSKGLGIIVNKRLYAKTKLDIKQVKYKSVYMNAFVGEFKVHYDIPDYFGLGKGVSHGFGCVKQIIDV